MSVYRTIDPLVGISYQNINCVTREQQHINAVPLCHCICESSSLLLQSIKM